MEHINKYLIHIYERFSDLKKSEKKEFDNNDLWKIFEYYVCIKLTEEYKTPFYEYDDIDPNFKELNKMTRIDTGIDCSDLLNTIVQCKLRKHSLSWKECSTFFGSQVIYSEELKAPVVRWKNLIIARNDESSLTENLLYRQKLFIDKIYNKKELLLFCENLILNPPKYPVIINDFKLRDYQNKAIEMITKNKKNVVINLPTGTGKNLIIIHSMEDDLKYLILVPRIILMEQLKKEIIKHKPKMKSKIQLIGDKYNKFDDNKLITICVYNSVYLIEKYCDMFEKIYVDEAHHINKPEIYYNEYEETIKEDNKYVNDDTEKEETIISDEIEEYFSEEEIISDDSEDELKNDTNYTKIIRNLKKYNNNVYLSATIDKIENFEYYSKDIRSMIDNKYLCDYQINVPIFNDDPTNKNICEYLLKNYRNIIIYCKSKKEGKMINKLMNELQLNSSEYIDCDTLKKKRDNILKKYKNGEMSFLVNVKILIEGYNDPHVSGVCFFHLSSKKTTLVQIIGRALRLHPTKTIANIILPYSLTEDKGICNFLKIMALNDNRLKKSFENKILGGYITLEKIEEEKIINEDDCNNIEEINEDIEFKYNMIYDSMGLLKNLEEIWMKKFGELKNYIDKYDKIPVHSRKNMYVHKLYRWMKYQINNHSNKKIINLKIYEIWNDFINSPNYEKYFISEEIKWKQNLTKIINYIDLNNTRPSKHDKDLNIRVLGIWLSIQTQHHKNKTGLMKKENINTYWTNFIDKYGIFFKNNEDKWYNYLNELIKYINTHNKIPNSRDNLIEYTQLSQWFRTQKKAYKTNQMNNENIYNEWSNFLNNYAYLFKKSNAELWNEKLKNVINYININNKIPSINNNDTKEITHWLSRQRYNFIIIDKIYWIIIYKIR